MAKEFALDDRHRDFFEKLSVAFTGDPEAWRLKPKRDKVAMRGLWYCIGKYLDENGYSKEGFPQCKETAYITLRTSVRQRYGVTPETIYNACKLQGATPQKPKAKSGEVLVRTGKLEKLCKELSRLYIGTPDEWETIYNDVLS